MHTNCSNNSGPWQFPEKLILVVILKTGLAATMRWYLDHQDWCSQVRQLSNYPANPNAKPSSLVAQRATIWFDAFGG